MSKRTLTIKRNQGAVIAEGAAALILLLPLFIAIIFVVTEASYAFFLKSSLMEVAREAARELSIAYGLDPSIADSRSAQDARVFNKIRMPNVVNDSSQFEDPVFDTGAVRPIVSVRVKYASQQFGLPPFPNPDVLNLSSSFVLDGSSSYRLQ
jgi:hypothetical protein